MITPENNLHPMTHCSDGEGFNYLVSWGSLTAFGDTEITLKHPWGRGDAVLVRDIILKMNPNIEGVAITSVFPLVVAPVQECVETGRIDRQAASEREADATAPAPVAPDLKPVGFLFRSDDGAIAYSVSDYPVRGFSLIGKIYGEVEVRRAVMPWVGKS